MTFNYTLANRVRTNLLLFTDKEIRTKISNINKIHNYYSNNLQIINEELFYSNTEENLNKIKIPKINIIRDDTSIETSFVEKHCSQKIEKSLSKFLSHKKSKQIHSSFEKINIVLGKKNHRRKSDKKLSNTMIYLKVGINQKSAKSYLQDLCNSFISKKFLRKNIFTRKIHLVKKKRTTKSIKKPRKSKNLSDNSCNKDLLRKSPSSINSFKLVVFGY